MSARNYSITFNFEVDLCGVGDHAGDFYHLYTDSQGITAAQVIAITCNNMKGDQRNFLDNVSVRIFTHDSKVFSLIFTFREDICITPGDLKKWEVRVDHRVELDQPGITMERIQSEIQARISQAFGDRIDALNSALCFLGRAKRNV